MEKLDEGIYDDGWQHLDNEFIVTIHSVPPEWTSVMRRMVVACDDFLRVVQRDLPAEDDESSEEQDDDGTNSYYEDESESY